MDDDTYCEKRNNQANRYRMVAYRIRCKYSFTSFFFFVFFFVNFFRDFIWLFPSFIFVSRVPCGAAQSSVDVSCKKIDRSIRHKYPYVEQGERCFESSNRLNIRSPASNLFKSVKTCNTVFSLKLSKRNARITE